MEFLLITTIIVLVVIILGLFRAFVVTERARIRHLNTIIMNIDAEFYAARDKLLGMEDPGSECVIDQLTYQCTLGRHLDELDALRDEIHAKYRYVYGAR